MTDVLLPRNNLVKILKVSLTNIIYTAKHPFNEFPFPNVR